MPKLLLLVLALSCCLHQVHAEDCGVNCTEWCNARELMSHESEAYHSYIGRHHHNVKLGMDQARLTIISNCNINISVQIRSTECFRCSFQERAVLEPNQETTIVIDTKYTAEIKVLVATVPRHQACLESANFQQYGNYTYHVSPNSISMKPHYLCVMSSDDPPLNVNVPVWILVGAIVLLFTLWSVVRFLDRKYSLYYRYCTRSHGYVSTDLGRPRSRSMSESETTLSSTEIQADDPPPAPVRARLKSLDTFRGISILLMIFVNYGGGEYWYFKHSPWNGLTVADLVFPWFIFIMGTSMVFSLQSQIRNSIPWYSILLKISKRSVILIILGLILNSKPTCPDKETRFETLRIPGVLQRFGVIYFITALIHLACSYKQPASKVFTVIEFIAHMLMLTVYLTITFLLPVPGCPTGYLGPGGLADDGKYENCTGGAAGYIDRLVFGRNHLYQHPTSHRIYGGTMPYDPEGLLGCLTSIFICYLGLIAGRIFSNTRSSWTVSCLLAHAVITTGIGVLLCEGSKETGWIPINKNLWSLSYVLCLAGTSFFLLSMCYFLIDVFRLWDGGPFIYAGMNPILLYVCHEIFRYYLPVSFHVDNNHWSHLAMDAWGTIFWMIVAYILHRKKLYFSI